MLSLFQNEKTLYKLISLGVLASILFFVGKIIYAGIIALPYPKELLEPANVALTNLFIEGKNPYSVSALSWDVPGINYDYPFLNSLVAALIARITTCNAVTAHFILSLASILVSGYIGILMVGDQAKTMVAPLLAAILFMFCHWRYGYISAAPDDFGLLLFLLTMYAATSNRVKNKPLVCAIGITLCFYTKQYFLFVSVGIFIYMLLYSRKEALKLLLWTAGLNVVTAIIIWYTMPLYFIKTILFTYLGTVSGGGSEISTFIEQMKYLISLFAALFAILIAAVSITIGKLIRHNKKIRNILTVKENNPFALCCVMTIVMMLPLTLIGRNDGAFITYFLQLWMPAIVVIALISFERSIPEKHENSFMIVYIMIAAFTIYFGFGKLPLHILTEDEVANWKKAYEYTGIYSEKGDIFYSRSLAYDGFARQNGEWMCGHDSEISEGTVDALAEAGLSPESLYLVQDLADQNVNYRNSMLKKAEDHEYSLITIDGSDAFSVFNEKYVEEQGYKCIDRLILQLGNMPYELVFFALN